jgi:hypothetical protein
MKWLKDPYCIEVLFIFLFFIFNSIGVWCPSPPNIKNYWKTKIYALEYNFKTQLVITTGYGLKYFLFKNILK